MDHLQYYPTTEHLGRKLCGMFQEEPERVLEPSAGDGHLLKAFRARFPRLNKDHIDLYEIDPEHHAALREQGTIRGLDFLEAGDLSMVSHIVMNPPFHQGVRHVLHAWNRLFSGEIAAILNASGVREPTTKEELRLAKIIADHGRVEYVEDAFLSPDTLRKTAVEIAMVYLHKEPTNEFWDGSILDSLEVDTFQVEAPEEELSQGMILHTGQIPALVRAFRAAWEARKESIVSAHRASRFTRFFQQEMNKAVGRDSYDVPGNLHRDLQESYQTLRHMAWMSVLNAKEFQKHLTAKAKMEIRAKFADIEKMEFSVTNIYGFLQGLALQQGNINAQMVCDLFDSITYANSENCLFYRWKSNEKHRIGMALQRKRFILSGFSLEGWRTTIGYGELQRLDDIDRVFALVDGKEKPDVSLRTLFEQHIGDLRSGERLSSTYFEIRFYPGIGTIHFYPKDQKMIDRINVIVGKHRGWMPETYKTEENPNYKAAEKMSAKIVKKINRYTFRNAIYENGYRQKESQEELAEVFEAVMQDDGVENFWLPRIESRKTVEPESRKPENPVQCDLVLA